MVGLRSISGKRQLEWFMCLLNPVKAATPQIKPFPGEFPDELCEMILGHLEEPPLECTLTCRKWLSICRRSRLELTTSTAQPLLPLLESDINTLSRNVTQLQVEGAPVDMCRMELSMWETLAQSFQDVNYLELVGVKFDSFDDFMVPVCSFRCLRTIVLEGLEWPAARELATRKDFQNTQNPLHVTSLVLNSDAAKDIAEWLLAQESVPIIDILHFETHKIIVNRAIRRLIEVTGEHMKELGFTMTFAKDVIKHNIDDSIDLGLCTHLRRLCLDNIILWDDHFWMTQKIPLWVPVMLEQVASPYLEQVTLVFHIGTYEGMRFMIWGEMDRILCSPRFAMLTEPVRFRVQVASGAVPSQVQKIIVEEMPSLATRNMMAFEFFD